MRNRLWMTVVAGCLLVAGCTTSVDGRPAAAPTSAGRTIAPPSADGPATRTSPGTDGSDPRPTADPTGEPGPQTTPRPSPEPDPGVDPAVGLPDVLFGPVDIEPGPDGYLVFQTPSGNIFCGLAVFEGTSASRCDLIEVDYPEPPAAPCDSGDFTAATASLVDDAAGVVGGCVSDTVIDASAVLLPYGFNAGAGDIVCHSAEEGVTCGNLVTGHGFQIARSGYLAF